MADGSYRFHQTGAGPFQHHNQYNHHTNLNRATSPRSRHRPFSTETPSPSRSPASSAMSHNFNMYNQNGYHGSGGLMNGGQNHQRYGGISMQKYQQPHNSHHSQMNHHQSQHQNATYGHQHTHSSGGFSATQHLGNFGPEHGQNGHIDNVQQEDFDEHSEYWREQIQTMNEVKNGGQPNYQAKMFAQQTKGPANLGSTGAPSTYAPSSFGVGGDDQNSEDRNRVSNDRNEGRSNWVELDCGGQGLRALAPAMFNYKFLHKLYLAHNKLDHLPPEISKLKFLEVLDLSYNELTELPEEIGMLTNLVSLRFFGNRIQSLPWTLGYLFKLKFLGMADNLLEGEMEDRYKQHGAAGLVHYLRENMPDFPPPIERPWHNLEDGAKPAQAPEKFKALTYNILAKNYATTAQYGYVAARYLDWDSRRSLILEEIRDSGADIVCLQELDRSSYDDFFREQLSMAGYQSYYAQKGRAETAIASEKGKVDGCGTFWKDKKYVVLDKVHLALGRKAVDRFKVGLLASSDLVNRVFTRDDIATVVLLESRVTGSRMIVANTHIFWNPAYRDVQLIQMATLLSEVSHLSEEYAKKAPCTNKKLWSFTEADDSAPADPAPEPGPSLSYETGTQIPFILCADLNSQAGSAVYNLLAHRVLEPKHPDLVDFDYGSLTENGMEHPLTLKSINDEAKLPFTNYTPGFVDVLDYIWYSSNTLRPTGFLGKVDEEYLSKVPGFPNQHFPSDHLALVAEFLVPERKKVLEKREADFGPSSRK